MIIITKNKWRDFFLQKSLLLTKPEFIWPKVQQEQSNLEIFLLFKLPDFYLNIF